MGELKNIKISEEGVFCYYYPNLHWKEPIIVPLSFNQMDVFLHSFHNGEFLGWINKGSIWCKSFKYKRFKKSIALNVYI